MKNCLIVLSVLFGCFVVAVFLQFELNLGSGRGFPGGLSYVVAEWRDYDDPGLIGLQVIISSDQITIDVPPAKSGAFKRTTEKGRWSSHNFYCDSHLDAPAAVVVASELKNEDLELDAGRFFSNHSGKITLVKISRGLKDYHPLFPVYAAGQTVSYPPPKGLIRPGMLECDLQTLPWRADDIESMTTPAVVDFNRLSDGSQNKNFLGNQNDPGDEPEPGQVYRFHTDRADLPPLLVTVYHGRVVQVVGGAEETADIPFTLPPPRAPEEAPAQGGKTSWAAWWFDLIFRK